MSQIEVNNLTLAYDGVPVLTDLTFSVSKGDYLCIVGENGSGKSTLIKCLAGLVKPLSGTVKFDCAKGERIGYLPQQQSAQRDFPASVIEVIMSGFAGKRAWPFYSKLDKKIAFEKAEQLKIESLLDRPFGELSGGQQQRVLLARALVASDGILLLDEPVNGLDPSAVSDMYSYIKELNDGGLTVIMISHDIKSAVSFADKILHLSPKGNFFGNVPAYMLSGLGDEFLKGGTK